MASSTAVVLSCMIEPTVYRSPGRSTVGTERHDQRIGDWSCAPMPDCGTQFGRPEAQPFLEPDRLRGVGRDGEPEAPQQELRPQL
jgi:hypothetical protein